MSKRLNSFLAVLLLLAPVSLARVISYAPYTDQGALRGYHSRTSRHFILLEAAARDVTTTVVHRGKVVLYDSKGIEEPRTIYPPGNEVATIRFGALFQADENAKPVILIGVYESLGPNLPAQGLVTKISVDGGATWRRIEELNGAVIQNDTDVDFGGPWTRGMAVPVHIGTASHPFIVGYRNGVFAIPPTGPVRLIASGTEAAPTLLVGRNLMATKFIVRKGTELHIADLNGASRTITTADPYAQYSGWITSDDSVYLLRHRVDGRYLSFYRGGQKQSVGGPYDTPEPGNSPPAFGRDTMSFFAVPTHDFEGAWLLNRDATKPTVLSRHDPGKPVAQMWADISGPEVEALHAGASGQRLLIQVHREREVQEVPFRDPALAVWTVGTPAPRLYDELFMNEGFTKGFVHVDVDKLADGDPFVFDSGFIQGPPPDIVVSPPVSGGGDVIQEWGVVRGSLKQRLVFPGVARLPGAFNSYWQTDVVIYNPLDQKQDVTVQFVPLGESVQIAAASTVKLTLEPLEIRVVNDALKTLFNVDNGGGAFYLLPAEGVNATARTYSKAPGGGSFGFGMMAIDIWNAAGPRFPLSFSGAFPGPNFRTNVLLTDTSGRGTEARLQAYGVSGTIGAVDVSVAAPTNGVSQTNGIGGMLGLFAHQAGGLVVQPSRGTAIPTVVAIDNRTNDPTYFPPDLPASTVRTIPVIGHLDGANGSRFRSDVYLLNLATTTRTVTLEVKPWESTAWPRMLTFTLLPNEARVIEDALFKLFNLTGTARLRYWSDGGNGDSSGVRVTSRTYTIEENGNTYGCLIPPLNNFQSATAGESLEIIGIVGGSGFRTNVGLVELTPNNNGTMTSVRLTIVDEKGKVIDRFTVELPSAGGMQINDIFGQRGVTPPAAARIVVQVLNATGLVGAYATLTDNVTNDSTFLGANLGASPD